MAFGAVERDIDDDFAHFENGNSMAVEIAVKKTIGAHRPKSPIDRRTHVTTRQPSGK